jgi:hypothetical protein
MVLRRLWEKGIVLEKICRLYKSLRLQDLKAVWFADWEEDGTEKERFSLPSL